MAQDKGIAVGLKALLEGAKAVGKQGLSTGGAAGGAVKGAANTGSNLIGGVLKLAGEFMSKYPKLSLVGGVFAAVKAMQKIGERRQQKQSLQQEGLNFHPLPGSASFAGASDTHFPSHVPVVPPHRDPAPRAPEPDLAQDDAQLAREVMAAMAVADQRRAHGAKTPAQAGSPRNWVDTVSRNSAATAQSL